MEQNTAAMKKGPMIFTAIQKSGFDADSVDPYIISFIILLVAESKVTNSITFIKKIYKKKELEAK